MVHEARYHEHKHFINPTYSEEHLPSDLSVSVRASQLFLKRLRHHFGPFRFFGVGEYGARTKRPHYHYIVYGIDLPDLVPFSQSKGGELLHRSELLTSIWGFGECLVGEVNDKSCGYVARYTVDKINGDLAAEAYRRQRFDADGVITEWQVDPPFAHMSLKPGIGARFADEFKSDYYPADFLIHDGQRVPVPKYYTSRLSESEQQFVANKRGAVVFSPRYKQEQTEKRLLTKHTSAKLRNKAILREKDIKAVR